MYRKQRVMIALLSTLCWGIALGQTSLEGEANDAIGERGEPIHQLRIYEIPKENQQLFNERFRCHALRIMKKYDFKIVAIWEAASEEKLEFIYLLEWKDEKAMRSAWDKFMSDQEWKDIKAVTGRLHGVFVKNIKDRTLILTGYSPQRALLDQTDSVTRRRQEMGDASVMD